MSRKTIDALRRADFALAGAVLLMLATAGTATAINPHTDQIPSLRPSIVHEAVAQIAHPATVVASIAPKAVTVLPTADQLAALKILADVNCLAQAMYYEARGEGLDGQKAIAEVVFHRMHAAGYPGSICGVVYQGSGLDRGCQFSFTCDGELHHARSPGAWARARMLAARILSGRVRLDNITAGATAFHAVEVQPDWADGMSETVQIGNHVFYRRMPRTQAS